MAWITPIVDRTQQDVNRVVFLNNKGYENLTEEEKAEYSQNLKGALNFDDIDRIVTDILELQDRFDITPSATMLRSGDIILDVPTNLFFRKLFNSLRAIREQNYAYSQTPQAPSLPWNTWQKYNDVEQILLDAYTISNQGFYQMAGSGFYAGEEISLLL